LDRDIIWSEKVRFFVTDEAEISRLQAEWELLIKWGVEYFGKLVFESDEQEFKS